MLRRFAFFLFVPFFAATLAAAGGEYEEEVAAAITAGDECSSAVSESGTCALSALQLRSRRRAGHGAGRYSARSGYEAAQPHLGGWRRDRRADGAELHDLSFVVRQRNLEQFRAVVRERTEPGSPTYRRWLSRSEVQALTDTSDTVKQVVLWLKGHEGVDILHVSGEGELVQARAPVATWEALLSTEFHVHSHQERSALLIRASEYLLPEEARPHVDGVLGAVDYESLLNFLNTAPVSPELRDFAHQDFGYATVEDLSKAKHNAIITPDVLRAKYNIPRAAPRLSEAATSQAKTWQVVYATLGQSWSPSDRAQFERAFDIPQDNYVVQLDGHLEGNAKSGDQVCREDPVQCSESNLDVQYMMGVAPWARIGYWYVPKATPSGMAHFLTVFMDRYVHTDEVPSVISISYGMPEMTVTSASLVLFETLAMKLAARGVTVLVASGDDGAGSHLSRMSLGGKECWSDLQASWPAISEWVTAVGATMGAEQGQPEVACSVSEKRFLAQNGTAPLITTGGGFSQGFRRPHWQNVSHEDEHRGVPDLSIAGHAYSVVIGTRWLTIDGTSASAPVVAGMISLINAELIQRGQPTVGFLNPLLYKESSKSIFTDITEGDNKCASKGAPCCGGYDAGPGWDAVTGLGTPDYEKLLAAVLAWKAQPTEPAESEPAAPAEAEMTAPPAADSVQPVEVETTAPPAAESAPPAQAETTAPPAAESAAPPAAESAPPAEGETPAPPAAESAVPPETDAADGPEGA